MSRIGVFVCHCGTNIAATVDCDAVRDYAATLPNVVHAEDNKYTCSDPGQAKIKEAIEKYDLDRIVVAACSPAMHELTWRNLLSQTKINPYMLEVANLREQCSWVHTDYDEATAKAKELVRMAVAKVDRNVPLFTQQIPVNKRALVVGGGIAGMQAALDIADAGYQVTIVEREATIGGKMPKLDKTFPTMDCSACICTPKMSETGNHPNITVKTLSEVEKVDGYVGNFQVTIREHAKYVDYDKCTGCGLCSTKCPNKRIPNEWNELMDTRPAIYKPFEQAVPSKPVIDPEHCTMLTRGKCGLCAKVCPTGAINYEDVDKVTTETYGAVVLATGYDLIKWQDIYPEYGGGAYPDVIDGLHFERLVNASGPTEGHILRPSDGKEPKSVVIIKCVGSRDPNKGRAYCSRACCMYGAKHAHQYLDKVKDGRCYVFYMDVRTPGRRYDEFYMQAKNDGALYLRGRVSKIYKEGDHLVVLGNDTIMGENVQVDADMVVVETAMVPSAKSRETAMLFGVQCDEDGWITEAHPKLRPVETASRGIYLAGAAQGPKDIPDTVAQAGAAASKVIGMFSHDTLDSEPQISHVDVSKCSGCGQCVPICPYGALSLQQVTLRENSVKVTRQVCEVNSALCQGCGACTVACRPGALDLLGFTDEEIMREVDALCQW